MKRWQLLLLALAIVLVGCLVAYNAQTSGGTITVRDVRWAGTNGTMMSGLLYIPEGVTNETPAPGVLAIHGYINSRETQDGFAIEFARRGYVTLALDQTGHGYSGGAAFANGFGGPDGLAYLRTLDIVDKDNVGISGHSMGGWASIAAAGVYPDDYKAIILEGSSTGEPILVGTADVPRNLGLIFSEWDEFASPMWGSGAYYGAVSEEVVVASDIVNAEKLRTLFDTGDEAVVVGQMYGSIEDGTARQLYMPRTTHPGDHISTEAIGNAVEWFQMTLEGGNDLAPSDQVWYWREIGGFIALIGMILFMFPLGAMLLDSAFFKDLVDAQPEFKGLKGWGWWLGAALLVLIPILSYFWLQHRGNEWFPASAFWPQNITTGLMTWAVGNGLISAILFVAWHYGINKNAGGSTDAYGLTWAGKFNFAKIGKALLLAVVILVPTYMLLVLADWLFKIDFRLWVLAFKPMSARHFGIMLAYLPFFGFFFLVLSNGLMGQMRRVDANGNPIGLGRAMLINVVMLIVGFVGLLLIQYVPLLTGGPMPLGEPLLSIVAFQFIPIMAIVALLLTYFARKTGRIYLGAFLCAMLVTWYIVAGQAIHFAF